MQELFEGFLTLRDRAFFYSLAPMSGKVIILMHNWTRKFLLNFVSHSDRESACGLQIRIRFALVEVWALQMMSLFSVTN